MRFNELFSSNDKPITLQCKKPYYEDGYIDPDMRCVLIGTIQSTSEPEILWLQLDLEPYAERNTKLELPNYWDKNGHPTLTATQAGFAPPFKTYKPWILELCVVGDEEIDEWFTIVND